MIRLVVLACAVSLLTPRAAHAEVGIGPPVVVWVPQDSRLVDVVHAIVSPDDPTDAVAASVTATVSAGDGAVATLGPYEVVATGRPQRLDMPLPADAVARLRAVAARFPHAYATASFAVRHMEGVLGPRVDEMQSRMSLFAPVVTHRPTTLDVDDYLFDGDLRAKARGVVAVQAPPTWRRTSSNGTRQATFSPIAVTPGCRAYARVDSQLLARKKLAPYLDNFMGYGGVRRGRTVAVRATSATARAAFASAVGFRQVAPHHYAGVEIALTFDPECPPQAGRNRALLRTLTALVRGVTAHVAITRRAGPRHLTSRAGRSPR